MKPANLREFAEKLYASAHRHADFGKEILELLDRDEDSIEAEMAEELEHQCQNAPANVVGSLQRIEYLGGRDDVLTSIEEKITESKAALKRYGLPVRALADVDDTVEDLLALLDDIETVLHCEFLPHDRGEIMPMLDAVVKPKPIVYDL